MDHNQCKNMAKQWRRGNCWGKVVWVMISNKQKGDFGKSKKNDENDRKLGKSWISMCKKLCLGSCIMKT